MVYGLVFAFVLIQTDKYTLNSRSYSGAEGKEQGLVWVSALTLENLRTHEVSVRRVVFRWDRVRASQQCIQGCLGCGGQRARLGDSPPGMPVAARPAGQRCAWMPASRDSSFCLHARLLAWVVLVPFRLSGVLLSPRGWGRSY